MTEYVIDIIDRSDFHLLLPLMKDCFNLEMEQNYFEWKYILNPSGTAICIGVKNKSGDIIAFEALLPEEFIIDKRSTILYHSVDTMTHSAHRRNGLYKKIAFKGFEILESKNNLNEYGFGGDMSTPAILKFGWEILLEIRYFFKTYYQCKLNCFNVCKNKESQDFIIKEISETNEIIELKNKLIKPVIYKFFDENIYNWKLSHPLYQFHKIGLYNLNGKLNGYAVYYFHNNKIFLYDFGFIESISKKEQKLLFNAIEETVLKNKLKGIVTFSQDQTIFAETLKCHGFISNKFKWGPLNKKIPFLLYSKGNDFVNYKKPDCWAITPIYHDSL
ncbi:MAG: GNAT family N-acetyltransferase [Bacteroidales bacterium]|nr:GNAT family N-acetyltransferase [Bacteroidales bacterium]